MEECRTANDENLIDYLILRSGFATGSGIFIVLFVYWVTCSRCYKLSCFFYRGGANCWLKGSYKVSVEVIVLFLESFFLSISFPGFYFPYILKRKLSNSQELRRSGHVFIIWKRIASEDGLEGQVSCCPRILEWLGKSRWWEGDVTLNWRKVSLRLRSIGRFLSSVVP